MRQFSYFMQVDCMKLIKGKYVLSAHILSPIDQRPWWGLVGQWDYSEGGTGGQGDMFVEAKGISSPFLVKVLHLCRGRVSKGEARGGALTLQCSKSQVFCGVWFFFSLGEKGGKRNPIITFIWVPISSLTS